MGASLGYFRVFRRPRKAPGLGKSQMERARIRKTADGRGDRFSYLGLCLLVPDALRPPGVFSFHAGKLSVRERRSAQSRGEVIPCPGGGPDVRRFRSPKSRLSEFLHGQTNAVRRGLLRQEDRRGGAAQKKPRLFAPRDDFFSRAPYRSFAGRAP